MSSFEKLSDCWDTITAYLQDKQIVLADELSLEPMAYGTQQRLTGPQSFAIESIKGKGTRKRLQVVIERFGLSDGPARMGRYELVFYTG